MVETVAPWKRKAKGLTTLKLEIETRLVASCPHSKHVVFVPYFVCDCVVYNTVRREQIRLPELSTFQLSHYVESVR